MPVNNPMHTQPPSIEDPPQGEAHQWEPGTEVNDESDTSDMTDAKWLRLAGDAYDMSTSYVDSNYRAKWNDSIRAFHSEHPTDSKFNSEIFRKRSHLYRPKVRAIIRKNEAAAAGAFFSNMDRISIAAEDQDDKAGKATADVLQKIVQYRLTKSIPWFHITMGGLQDTNVQGAAVAHCHWRFVKDKEDRPVIDLVPIENMRFDSGASWTDPLNTSPYLIHLIPMYIVDIKDRMDTPDAKGQKWHERSDAELMQCTGDIDSTRQARNDTKQDPTTVRKNISDYDTVWVHRHIHRFNGTDYEFYTLQSRYLLTDPVPLKESVFHGQRPYVLGICQLETHQAIPDSVPTMVAGLVEETNEVLNQRLDNVKLVLNKRWFATRGANVDTASLTRNVPGSITMMDKLDQVKSEEFQDITGSAYMEQDRINADFDDLVGNFSAASIQTQRNPREPARSMAMLQNPANMLTEYMLKTYSETFIVPVLRQLLLLEQYYETDMKIFNLAGKAAQISQRYGVDDVTNFLIEKEMNLTVNVGMGATDPVTKLQKFVYAVQSFGAISTRLPPGMSGSEIWKEISALSGYQDGSRFFTDNDSQAADNAMNQVKQLTMMVKQMQMQLKNKQDANVVKLTTAREKNQTTLAVAGMKEKSQNARLLAEHIMSNTGQALQAQAPQNPNPEGQMLE